MKTKHAFGVVPQLDFLRATKIRYSINKMSSGIGNVFPKRVFPEVDIHVVVDIGTIISTLERRSTPLGYRIPQKPESVQELVLLQDYSPVQALEFDTSDQEVLEDPTEER